VRATAERYLSLQEVGDELGVSDQTVRRWVKAGELAAYKPGKEYRIKGSDLEEFLQTREVSPKVQASLPDFGDGRRLSRFAEAIIAVAARWGEAVSSPEMADSRRFGFIDAALGLGGVIGDRVATRGIRCLEESGEARDQEEQVNQRRELVRELTRRIA
jgi:excisionase family DNA binding protein